MGHVSCLAIFSSTDSGPDSTQRAGDPSAPCKGACGREFKVYKGSAAQRWRCCKKWAQAEFRLQPALR